MAVPTKILCPECGAWMRLRESRYGRFWGCETFPVCRASHGAHPDGTPLGKPADVKTKQARILAHLHFDCLWKPEPEGLHSMDRRHAYQWVSSHWGKQLHMAELTEDECLKVIELVNRLDNRVAVLLAMTGGKI